MFELAALYSCCKLNIVVTAQSERINVEARSCAIMLRLWQYAGQFKPCVSWLSKLFDLKPSES